MYANGMVSERRDHWYLEYESSERTSWTWRLLCERDEIPHTCVCQRHCDPMFSGRPTRPCAGIFQSFASLELLGEDRKTNVKQRTPPKETVPSAQNNTTRACESNVKSEQKTKKQRTKLNNNIWCFDGGAIFPKTALFRELLISNSRIHFGNASTVACKQLWKNIILELLTSNSRMHSRVACKQL